MANFTSSSSSLGAFDDSYEDACSICLEHFSTDDPATITSCKHEYHLHCILEWSQRSKECPICWQLLILKDPASQELLITVEAERSLISRNVHSYASTLANFRSPIERRNEDHHLVAAASRARYICRGERQRSPGTGPSEVLVFNSCVPALGMQPKLTTSPSGSSSPTSDVPSAAHIQPPTSSFSHVGMVTRNTFSESDDPSKPSVLYNRSSPECVRGPNTYEMFSFPESIKSKLFAASARCKESISKNTRGLKEKLIARNASIKELGKGVQREMNAGIAGVARMIDRLDLTSKRSTNPSEECGILVGNVTSNAPSLNSSLVDVEVEIPPSCVQSGDDVVMT